MINPSSLSLAQLRDYDPQARADRYCCPFCGDEKPRDAAHRCLSVDAERGLYHCFRCHASGLLDEFKTERAETAFERQQWRRQKATQRLRRSFDLGPASAPATPSSSVEVPVEDKRMIKQSLASSVAPPTGQTTAPPARRGTTLQDVAGELWPLWAVGAGEAGRGEVERAAPGRRYLARRGLEAMASLCCDEVPPPPLWWTDAAGQMAKIEIYWGPRFFGRPALVFPLRDMMGGLVGFHGRYIDGHNTPKSRTMGEKKNGAWATPGTWRTDYLPALIVTEAPLDALSLHAAGYPAIALCGTSAPHWLHRRCGLNRVMLAFDADAAGDEMAERLAAQLATYSIRCTRLRPPDAKDWNEQLDWHGVEALADFLAGAVL